MDDASIRIGRTVDEATKFTFGNLLAILRVGWFPIALAIALATLLVWSLWQPIIVAYLDFFDAFGEAAGSGASGAEVDFDFGRIEAAMEQVGAPRLIVGYVALILIMIVGYSIPMTAYARMMVLGERYAGPFYFRLGRPELQVALTYIAITVITTLALMAISTMGTLLVALASGGGQPGPAGGAVALGVLVVSIVVFVWLFSRLAIALPTSAVEGGVPIARAWALSRGQGGTLAWVLILGYLVILVLTILFAMALSILTSILLGVLSALGSQLAPIFVGAVAAVGYIAIYCFNTALFMALFSGPYKTLAGEEVA